MPLQLPSQEEIVTKLETLQYIIEVGLATSFGRGRADECEASGRYIAEHARKRANTPSEAINARGLAVADEVERIYRNAAERIRESQ